MTGLSKVLLAVVFVPLLAVCGIGVLVAVAVDRAGASCAAADESTGSGSAEQVGNATTIVRVGAELGVPRRGWVIAVATAMQESGLRNLGDLGPANDHDSLGLFQQRPSQGWGNPTQLTDPVYAATAFYRKLLTVAGWQQMPLTQAAQTVQVSAYPDAYAAHEAAAAALVSQIAGRLGLPGGCAGGWVLPLPAGSYQLTSGYGPRWGVVHYGQDFAAPPGTPIYAVAAGTVVSAGCTSPFCDRPGEMDSTGMPTTRGCGWRVRIQHPGAIATTYCHALAMSVHTGQVVAAGQVIGWVGSTGNSTGPHLHFQVHVHAPPISDATTVDPLPFLRGVGLNP